MYLSHKGINKSRCRLKLAQYSTTCCEYIKAWTAPTRASRKDWTGYLLCSCNITGELRTITLCFVLVGTWNYHGYTRTIVCTCASCLLVRVRTKAACCQICPLMIWALWFPCTSWLYRIALLTLILLPREATDPNAPCEDIPVGMNARPGF